MKSPINPQIGSRLRLAARLLRTIYDPFKRIKESLTLGAVIGNRWSRYRSSVRPMSAVAVKVRSQLRHALTGALLVLVVVSASGQEPRATASGNIKTDLGSLHANRALGVPEEVLDWMCWCADGIFGRQLFQVGLQNNHGASELVAAIEGLPPAGNNPSDDSTHSAAAQQSGDQPDKLWTVIWHGLVVGAIFVLAPTVGALLALSVLMGPRELWETLAIRDWCWPRRFWDRLKELARKGGDQH